MRDPLSLSATSSPPLIDLNRRRRRQREMGKLFSFSIPYPLSLLHSWQRGEARPPPSFAKGKRKRRDRIRSCYYVDERKRGKELRLLFRESFHSFDPRPSSSPSRPPMIRWERTRDLILELLQALLLPFGLWSFFALALGTFFIARRGEETRKKGRRGGWEG